ncbi:abortive infection system antitoxin AbiGi family protein [Dokdonia sp. Asnod1-B02]|uniref:abortive infection system antitoxin AbiGi family protein n=1 Tax=Dokdonia sp. Asnod1-B02 TaxID=3160573 RepID=UPI00386E13A6
MGLSPSTLFHFTSKTGLKGILRDNFKIKYCLENINHNKRNLEIAIPMVSFCDIKISEITDHIEKYGSYGIGLSKEWAHEKGLNPLLYLTAKSDFSDSLISSIREFAKQDSFDVEKRWDLTNILRYMKVN